MTPIPFAESGIPEEVLKLRPPTTPEQGAARRQADLALQDTYPGQYVAYIDNWAGGKLDRVVVARATETAEFQVELGKLPPDVRERVTMTLVPDPDAGIFAGGSGLV
jgi:hypothetical protein